MHASFLLQDASSPLLDPSEVRFKLLALACFGPSVPPVTVLLVLEEPLEQLGLRVDIVLQIGAVHVLSSSNLPQHFLKLQRRLPLGQSLAHINETIQQLTFLSKIPRLCSHPIEDELCDCVEVAVEGELLRVEVYDVSVVSEDEDGFVEVLLDAEASLQVAVEDEIHLAVAEVLLALHQQRRFLLAGLVVEC